MRHRHRTFAGRHTVPEGGVVTRFFEIDLRRRD